MRQTKDTKVSVVQTHPDAHPTASTSRLCLRVFGDLTVLPADICPPPGSAQPGRTSVSSRTNRVVKLSIHEHSRPLLRRDGGSGLVRAYLRLSTSAENVSGSKRDAARTRRRRRHMHFLGWDISAAPPSGAQSEARMHARPPGRQLYLGRRPGGCPRRTRTSNNMKVEQIFRVILQQAAQAWDGLSGTSPVHLRLPGLDKKDVLGASSCLPLRLPARTYTRTHFHTRCV